MRFMLFIPRLLLYRFLDFLLGPEEVIDYPSTQPTWIDGTQ
jgi:hypothetical protein